MRAILGIVILFGQQRRRNTSRAGAASSGCERGPSPVFCGEDVPKKAKHLWDDVTSYENLHAAFKKVRSGKRFHPAILKLYYDLDDRIFDLQQRLRSHTWRPAPYRQFWVQETKPRLIHAPAAIDRVVHWALMLQVGPVFDRRFIEDTYACREGRGAHLASRRLRAFLRTATALWGKPYILKADISKYFPSIDQCILMDTVSRLIGDPDVLWLFDAIIRNNGANSGVGIPIGALTSQWLANLYFDPVDHFIKDDMGLRFYLRYMDDFVIIGPTKLWCQTVLDNVRDFLACRRLTLNPKTDIFPASHGVDFVGYRHWVDRVLPRKRTVKRARKTFRSFPARYARGEIDLDYIRPRVASFTGYMGHCDGYATLEHILERLVLTRGE